MPFRCVAGGCSSTPDVKNNIALHNFPVDDESCPSERKRRRLWVNFVRTKRAKWSPTMNSRLYSKHFRSEDFEAIFLELAGTPFSKRSTLKKDAIPTVHAVPETVIEKQGYETMGISSASSSTRRHRQVSTKVCNKIRISKSNSLILFSFPCLYRW